MIDTSVPRHPSEVRPVAWHCCWHWEVVGHVIHKTLPRPCTGCCESPRPMARRQPWRLMSAPLSMTTELVRYYAHERTSACITSTNTHTDTLSLYSNASQQIDNPYSQNTKFCHSERGIPCWKCKIKAIMCVDIKMTVRYWNIVRFLCDFYNGKMFLWLSDA